VATELLGVVVDLDGEFAGGRDDERARLVRLAFGGRGVAQQLGEGGDEERGRFAGAGQGLARDIPAVQRNRQRLRLDGRAAREPQIGKAPGDGVGQVELIECVVAEVAFGFRHGCSLAPPQSWRDGLTLRA
jgi:hypothetical protein